VDQVGSGGIGAVSRGIAELAVLVLIPVAVLLLAFGLWKLAKFLLAIAR
jgi:hypothetical protein